jgi:hypothetical protein
VPGNIEWPSRLPGNPATDFVVRDAAYLDSQKDFRQNPSMPNWRCVRRGGARDARITSGHDE